MYIFFIFYSPLIDLKYFSDSILILGAKYNAEIIVGKAIRANIASTIFTAKSKESTEPTTKVIT
tara:strand:- start:23 stop:214 length:192 start_codon:yes stop_codon:yes gene_type:complete